MGDRWVHGRRRLLAAIVVAALVPIAMPTAAHGAPRAQSPAATGDSLVRLAVRVLQDSLPVEAAVVRSGRAGALTDASGLATLRLAAGAHDVVVAKLGLSAETLSVTLRAGQDTALVVRLAERAAEVERVVVAATRTERRIEDEPVRVEVLEREEIEEKMLMTPGDVSMMLNETSGLRVQTTSPSLGGANVRVQGLRGRYTQILSDGLPLYGGQAGGLGLLQIPPMDLGQVEVIKGSASALYGSQALGGVINLVSRRPGEEAERELLLNQTTRGGTDGVAWLSSMLTERAGYSLLAGAHYQDRRDVDGDGWTDLPGYRRAVVRPRFVWDGGAGRSVLVTAGTTLERREGGTLPGESAPDGVPFVESLDTRRFDAGLNSRFLLAGGRLLGVRGSATEQRHGHQFGQRPEDDRHRTAFAEATLSAPLAGGRATVLAGVAFQRETYASEQLPHFDYAFSIPSAFAQAEADPARWLSVSATVRADRHSEYGTFVNPRLSVLGRLPREWTVRASYGTGTFAPTPFTEETEVTGLSALLPPDAGRALEAERAQTASLDLSGAALGLELNGTLFWSRVRNPLDVVRGDGPSGPSSTLTLVNADGDTRTAGGELLARWRAEPFVITGTYTLIRSTEFDVEEGGRRDVPLVPRHAVGIVGMYEVEDVGRAGLELYYTGRQALEDNPFRTESRPYVILGALAERRVGPARVFVNAENLLDVRQTRWDPLVRPARGPGGRWTTDVWTELAGRTINGGVRLDF